MKLRIATLNTWALPPPIGVRVGWRMRRIAERLRSLQLDVIGFQEVWTAAARRRLIRGAREAGLEHIWHNPEEPGAGGLLVASRLPLEQPRFWQFALPRAATRVRDLNYYAGKGFVELRVLTPAGPLRLVDTHLHSQSRRFRMAQIVELAGQLFDREEPLVTLGDFNFRPDEPEYGVLAGLSGLRDAALLAGGAAPTTFPGNPFRARDSARRIDYVFVRDGARGALRSTASKLVFDEFFEHEGLRGAYSDHAGVFAEIELSPRRDAVAWRPERAAVGAAREYLERARQKAESRHAQDRTIAATGGAGAVLAAVAVRNPSVSRRRLLRGALQVAGLAAVPPAAACAVFSGLLAPDELRIYEHLAARLDRIAERTGRDLA